MAGGNDNIALAPAIREHFTALLRAANATASGSATLIDRLALTTQSPAPDLGEITEKRSLNQRAITQHRREFIERLYRGELAEAIYMNR